MIRGRTTLYYTNSYKPSSNRSRRNKSCDQMQGNPMCCWTCQTRIQSSNSSSCVQTQTVLRERSLHNWEQVVGRFRNNERVAPIMLFSGEASDRVTRVSSLHTQSGQALVILVSHLGPGCQCPTNNRIIRCLSETNYVTLELSACNTGVSGLTGLTP
jgi:hypothetical protein